MTFSQDSDPGDLSNLIDIVEPAAVPFWPLAPGWYGLFGLVVVTAVVAAFLARRRHHARAYRRAALAALDRIGGELDARDEQALRALPSIVKRTALAAFPRSEVASLSGTSWLEFLDDTAGTKDFTKGEGRHLVSLAYDPSLPAELDAGRQAKLLDAVRHWILRHEVRSGAPMRTRPNPMRDVC